ncbi:hypothetical protein OIU76_005443 [Salix suchowensis]|nr:hypothetical protein OIU76_005443 [Salix suchowensis]
MATCRMPFTTSIFQTLQKIFPEQSYNMLGSNNQFNLANNDDMDDTDAATSDSSEPDFLWQLNQSKFTSMTNGIESKTRKAISKASKIPGIQQELASLARPFTITKVSKWSWGFPCNGTEGRQVHLTGNARSQLGSRKVSPAAGGFADYIYISLIFFSF